MENCLKNLLRNVSRTLCKYRTCNHNLPIKRGKYIRLERGMRLCEICDLKELGDEYHYICYICVCKNKNITILKESILPRY